jgi:hypothetical protein
MGNYHVLHGLGDGNSVTVAMHIPIPNVNNISGVNYRAAIAEYATANGISLTSKVPAARLGVGEQSQLTSGALVEIIVQFDTNPGENTAAKVAALDQLYQAKVSETQEIWEKRLQYWGYSRTIS